MSNHQKKQSDTTIQEIDSIANLYVAAIGVDDCQLLQIQGKHLKKATTKTNKSWLLKML